MSNLWVPSFPIIFFVLRGAVVYIGILLLLRLAGKREVGQMGTGEFVAVLLISNAVQNSMNGGDNSITGGLILAAVIVSLSALVAYLTFKSRRLENLLQGRPRILIHQGEPLHKNLEKEFLTLKDLRTMLRKQGIHDIHEIHEAILESDGSVSVIRTSDLHSATKP